MSIMTGAVPYLTLTGAAALACGGVGMWIAHRRHNTPEIREKRRRLAVNERNRLVEATLLEVRDSILIYSYCVCGVHYTTSQDVSRLTEYLQGNIEALTGPATVKYTPDNPANSIILCEEWSGLRGQSLRCADI